MRGPVVTDDACKGRREGGVLRDLYLPDAARRGDVAAADHIAGVSGYTKQELSTIRLVSLEWEQTIVDARDPRALGLWWRDALGWVVVNDDPDEFEIRPTADRLPGLLFVPVSEPKTTKNRLHLDFRPDDRDAEVERLLALGATRADIGQGEQTWIVLADPEGNEFCVLGSRGSSPGGIRSGYRDRPKSPRYATPMTGT